MGLLKLLLHRGDTDDLLTYKQRVERFWKWWGEESARILSSVDADGGRAIQTEISQAVERLCPGLAWVFGPGSGAGRHSFTLSPEGNRHRLFLACYWLSRAPDIPEWSFYSSRQPSPDVSKFQITMGDASVAANDIWLDLEFDETSEKFHLLVWSPSLAEVAEHQANQILYLLLDEALGEIGTERWLGAVEMGPGKTQAAVSLPLLRNHIERVASEKGWRIAPPEETYGVYQIKQPLGKFPRGDTVAGTTRNADIVGEFLKMKGPIEDPVAGSGADYVYVVVPRDVFPPGNEVAVRGEIEDAIEAELKEGASGLVLGGAWGLEAGYVDLLLFDGASSRVLVERALDKSGVAGRHRLESFVK